MHCPGCNTANDRDASFCIECGKPSSAAAGSPSAKSRRPYLFLFFLLPALALLAGVGYYKFFLPKGIAAVVNGEEITVSELDAAVSRMGGAPEAKGVFRRRVLNDLIAERLMLQSDPPAKATIRIALSEQCPGPGCGGCNTAEGQAHEGKSMPRCGCPLTNKPISSSETAAAIEACLQYWHAKHGPDEVSAQVKDFGCHLQVAIVRNNKIIGSLRYKGGSIIEP